VPGRGRSAGRADSGNRRRHGDRRGHARPAQVLRGRRASRGGIGPGRGRRGGDRRGQAVRRWPRPGGRGRAAAVRARRRGRGPDHVGGARPGPGRGPGQRRDHAARVARRRVPVPDRPRHRPGRRHQRRRGKERGSMTAITAELVPERDVTYERSSVSHFATDVWVLTKRSIARIRREPETLADVTIMPVILILMFAYVFGGAFLLPGPASYPASPIGVMPARARGRTAPGAVVARLSDRSTAPLCRFWRLP